MNRNVFLKVFLDHDTGGLGVMQPNVADRFNPFWDAGGIFHDVFEHYFEEEHKYFRGDNAFTLFGEAAASGHALAYSSLGIDTFKSRGNYFRRNYQADTKSYIESYLYEIKQGREDGWLEFTADSHLCKIPHQRSTNNYDLESEISDYMCYLNDNKKVLGSSVWPPGFLRAYRWGFKQATKIIGEDTEEAYIVMDNFLDRWGIITKNPITTAAIGHEMAYGIYGFNFEITHKKGVLCIKETVVDELRNHYPIELLTFFNP